MDHKSKCNTDPPQSRSCKMCDIIKKVEESLKEKTDSCVVKEETKCPEQEEPPPVEEPPKEDKCGKEKLVQKRDPCKMCKILSDMDPDKPKEPPKKEAECKVEPPKQRNCQMCQIIKKIESDRPEAERTEECEARTIIQEEEIACSEEEEKPPPEEKCKRQVIPDDFCTRKKWAADFD
nr:unnamed protein product [Callosobruchus analis]